jgi:hypothetical protein
VKGTIITAAALVAAAALIPLASAELIRGTPGADTLTGTSGCDYIHGR